MAFQSFLTFWTRLRATCSCLHATGSTVDLGLTCQLHISYEVPLSKLKKKLVKFFLHTNVRLKRMDGQVCLSVHILNGRLNLHVHPVRQPWTGMADGRMGAHADEGSERIGGQADERTSGRGRTVGGQADRRTGAGRRADGRTGWRTGGLADEQMGSNGGGQISKG